MDMLVKICGIDSIVAADAALAGRADFCGLTFHPASPRYLRPETARALADRMRGRTRIVALVCDPTDDRVAEVVRLVRPDLVQLHGNETPARVAEIRARSGAPVMKALAIADVADFAPVAGYEAVADMLLFDSKAPPASSRPGGHGSAFDWQLLQGRRFSRPWLLAGGLTAENVARAIASSGARGVDVSTGVESAPGVKTPDRIQAFITSARAPQLAAQTQTP